MSIHSKYLQGILLTVKWSEVSDQTSILRLGLCRWWRMIFIYRTLTWRHWHTDTDKLTFLSIPSMYIPPQSSNEMMDNQLSIWILLKWSLQLISGPVCSNCGMYLQGYNEHIVGIQRLELSVKHEPCNNHFLCIISVFYGAGGRKCKGSEPLSDGVLRGCPWA